MGKTRSVPPAPAYDCGNCPAYCCSSVTSKVYVTLEDVKRAARVLGLTTSDLMVSALVEDLSELKPHERRDFVGHWRTKDDRQFGGWGAMRCTFLDATTRRCGIYAGRPGACQRYPGTDACHFYDALQQHRRDQHDPSALLRIEPAPRRWLPVTPA